MAPYPPSSIPSLHTSPSHPGILQCTTPESYPSSILPRPRNIPYPNNLAPHLTTPSRTHSAASLPKLETLNMSTNGIGDEGARGLAAALVASSSITFLDLHACAIGDQG